MELVSKSNAHKSVSLPYKRNIGLPRLPMPLKLSSSSIGRFSEWDNVASMIAAVNSNITAVYTFGYYSSHTVCLPTLFPNRIDRAWHYTLLLLIINFMAFVFMLVAYVLLYR